jgi:hypothetical protein
MKPFFYRGRFIFIPIAIAAFLSLISFVVMNLWNYLLPGILHVGFISFWQAMGIFILCKILFGFGGKGGHRGIHGGAPWMRRRMEDRFRNMSPEEKEKFKAKMQSHMCNRRGWGRGFEGFDKKWDDFATDTGKATE